ncbi:recombinase family protein [Brevibacillus humidisoli]
MGNEFKLSEQINKIEAYCISQGWKLAKMFIDEGESGSTTERGRLP